MKVYKNSMEWKKLKQKKGKVFQDISSRIMHGDDPQGWEVASPKSLQNAAELQPRVQGVTRQRNNRRK